MQSYLLVYYNRFSKLKLIKFYLRSTMFQERLNELSFIWIEKEMLKKIDYNKLIKTFRKELILFI